MGDNIKDAHGAIINHHGLYNHRSTAEHLHISVQQTLQTANGKFFGSAIVILHGNSLNNAHYKTNQAADKSTDHCQ